MTFNPLAIFHRSDKYEGVRRINIYLLRLVFILMFFVLGKDTWTHVLTHWVILPIVAVPWGYVFTNYIYKAKAPLAAPVQPQAGGYTHRA